MKNAKWFSIVLICCIAFGFTNAEAQVKTGFPPFSSTTGGPDAINLANLNVHWSSPIIGKAGRGLPFSYSLEYDSSIWSPVYLGTTLTWQPAGNWGWAPQTNATTGQLTYYTDIDQYNCIY